VNSLQPAPNGNANVTSGTSAAAHVLAGALLWPLETAAGKEHAGKVDRSAMGMLRALGERACNDNVGGKRLIRALLEQGRDVWLEELVEVLHVGLMQLAASPSGATTSEGGNELRRNDKFLQPTLHVGRFSMLTDDPLGDLIGSPNSNLHEGMRREHCQSGDSNDLFKTFNYGTTTTSEIEWWFVDGPKTAPEMFRVVAPEDGTESWRMLRDGWPQTETGGPSSGKTSRQPLDPDDFAMDRRQVNHRLQAAGHTPLVLEEFIAARHYTGPMYTKCMQEERQPRMISSLLPCSLFERPSPDVDRQHRASRCDGSQPARRDSGALPGVVCRQSVPNHAPRG
jgi:hypothetical protein